MESVKSRYVVILFCLLVLSLISSNASAQEPDYQVYLPLILSPFPPEPFDKYSPADGATDQNLVLGLWWVSSENVTYYEYCIDSSDDNSCADWISTGLNNYVVPPQLAPNTTYYWQVRAWNGSVGPIYANGDPQSFWNFTTIDLNPAPFNKYSPADGATEQDLFLGLWWVPSERATSYEYCLDTTNDNACSNWVSTGTDNFAVTPQLTRSTTYYWQVRAWNDSFGPTFANGSSTAFWSFLTTDDSPKPFGKYSPADGAIDQDLILGLWWVPSERATSYEYCLDTTNDNSCTEWISTGANNYVIPPELSSYTTYYWQVRAWNEGVGPVYANGSPAAFWSLRTKDVFPTPFTKYSPQDGATNQDVILGLWWVPAERVTNYEYCIDTSNDNACSNWISTGINNYAIPPQLIPNTTYYWQVRAWNGTYGPTYANGSASAYWSFTTKVMQPGAFSKTSPVNGYDGTTMSPVLSWNSSTISTKYEYCYDTSNDGTCSNWISTGTNTYVGLSGLQAGVTYYWQARSWNGTYGPTYADGSASAYWSFKTLTTGVWIMDNCSLYESASGSYMYFICEIYNNTTTGIEFFKLFVDLYDVNGNLIGTDYSYAPLSIIHPQETACVDVMFENLPNFDYLNYGGTYYETSERRPSLSISNHSGHPGSYAYETLGIITNNSASTVNGVNAVASLYINNIVVGCDYDYAAVSTLAPGQQSSFNTYTWLPNPYAITWYKLQADGWISTQNSLADVSSEKIFALGGGKSMRLMDRSTLFQIGP